MLWRDDNHVLAKHLVLYPMCRMDMRVVYVGVCRETTYTFDTQAFRQQYKSGYTAPVVTYRHAYAYYNELTAEGLCKYETAIETTLCVLQLSTPSLGPILVHGALRECSVVLVASMMLPACACYEIRSLRLPLCHVSCISKCRPRPSLGLGTVGSRRPNCTLGERLTLSASPCAQSDRLNSHGSALPPAQELGDLRRGCQLCM